MCPHHNYSMVNTVVLIVIVALFKLTRSEYKLHHTFFLDYNCIVIIIYYVTQLSVIMVLYGW